MRRRGSKGVLKKSGAPAAPSKYNNHTISWKLFDINSGLFVCVDFENFENFASRVFVCIYTYEHSTLYSTFGKCILSMDFDVSLTELHENW